MFLAIGVLLLTVIDAYNYYLSALVLVKLCYCCVLLFWSILVCLLHYFTPTTTVDWLGFTCLCILTNYLVLFVVFVQTKAVRGAILFTAYHVTV